MKTRLFKMDWLVPLVGIAVVAGSVMAARAYLDVQRATLAAQALDAPLDRLRLEQQLTAVLQTFHDGHVAVAEQRLDLLLCQNILVTDAELGSADAQARDFARYVLRDIALMRPKATAGVAGSAQQRSGDQAAAESVLSRALALTNRAQLKQAGGENGAVAGRRKTVLPPAQRP